jgi:Ubiquitin-activating enzyme E1 FCCH domain/Baseplate J-like protein
MSGTTIPIVMGPSGMVPAQPANVQSALLASVAATNPGYTANLPGTLIEDISSTDVAAILACDSALVDLVNSITPYGANQFLLNQLGQIYGVQQGQATNTSVYVVFSGSAGYVIPAGFVVSDGTYQYIVQDGGIVATSGTSAPLYCLASSSGSWAVPANTVTTIATSVPSGVTLTVSNPNPGTPSAGAQPISDFRTQVLIAGLAASTGMPRYLKTQLGNVAGVQNNLVSVVQSGTNWKVIVGGGGDPYQIAYAIYSGLFDTANLVGSVMSVTAASAASAAVITTSINHGFVTGATITIAGATGMTGINGTWTATVLTPTTFSIPYNSTSAPSYTGGGVVTPNNRNQSITITDYPNTYTIPFVVPPLQTVSVSLTWNTIATASVSATAVASLGSAAIVSYINSISVGYPINVFEMQNVFQIAISSILQPQFLTRMVFAVYINGILTNPASGTGAIYGDPESYFSTNSTLVTIAQG